MFRKHPLVERAVAERCCNCCGRAIEIVIELEERQVRIIQTVDGWARVE